MRPRPYQQQAIDSVYEHWLGRPAGGEGDEGVAAVGSTLVVMPTATGKTILFASILHDPRAPRGRILVLAHREELIFQAADKIKRVTGLDSDIEMADLRANKGAWGRAKVVVSTIQTQIAGGNGGRMSGFNPQDFGIVIVDEAHHSPSVSWQKVIDYYRQNPNLKVLGVTATPDRADEAALGQVYESVAYVYELPDAIRDGWLVPILQRSVVVEGLDYSQVRTTAGDLNGADLAAVMEAEDCLQRIAAPTIEIIGDRRALVFAASVAHAERLAEIFNRHKTGCADWLCGETPKEERRKMLAAYADGATQIMVNVGCLTEGFDDPGIQVVIMGRPTKSRSLYAQMVGRGGRPADEIASPLNGLPDATARRAMIAASTKPSLEVVDFVGNCGRHKLVTTADILGGNYDDAVIERAKEKAIEEQDGPVDMTEALAASLAEIEAEKRRVAEAEAARRARLVAKAQYSSAFIDPFNVLGIEPHRERGWDTGVQLTEKQRAYLERNGVDVDSLGPSRARQILNQLIYRIKSHKCTLKQAAQLKKRGYDPNATFDQARQIMDALARNRWQPLSRGVYEVIMGKASA